MMIRDSGLLFGGHPVDQIAKVYTLQRINRSLKRGMIFFAYLSLPVWE